MDLHKYDKDKLAKEFKSVAKQNGLKFGFYMRLLRGALSGLGEGPSVAEMLLVLGKDTSIHRLHLILDQVKKDNQNNQLKS